MQFKQWLVETFNPSHPDDQFEDAIADYVYGLISLAIRDFFRSNKQQKLSNFLVAKGGQQTNYGSAAQPAMGVTFKIPDTINGVKLPQHLLAQRIQVRIRPTSGESGASCGAGIIDISLNTEILQKAEHDQDKRLWNMLNRLNYQLHHEIGHTSSAKTNYSKNAEAYANNTTTRGSPEHLQGKVDYYTDAGEIRSYARQFAATYSWHFPSQPFDEKKLMQLASKDWKINLLVKGLREQPGSGNWGQEYAPYQKQMAAAGNQLLPLIKYFVDRRNTYYQNRTL